MCYYRRIIAYFKSEEDRSFLGSDLIHICPRAHFLEAILVSIVHLQVELMIIQRFHYLNDRNRYTPFKERHKN